MNTLFSWGKEHTPGILTGIGITGWVVASISAIGATPKAIKALKEKAGDENWGEALTLKEKVEVGWKYYIWQTILAAASSGCLIGSCVTSDRRFSALMAAYSLSESTLLSTQNNIRKLLSEEKVQEIQTAIAQENVDKNPPPVQKQKELVVLGTDKVRIFEPVSGRYVESRWTDIESAVNDLNRRMVNGEMYVSLNDFYDMIGLRHTDIGYDIGWNVSRGLINIGSPSSVVCEDGKPALAITYIVPPEYGYSMYG